MNIKSIQYPQNIINNLKKLSRHQQNLIINIPITQKLFDNLTSLEPALWEILIPTNESKNSLKFKNSFEIIPVPPKLFDLCESLKVNVSIQSNDSQIQLSALSPELSVIYTIRKVTIPRIFVALGMLQRCNIDQLKNLTINYYPTQEKLIRFILDLASIRLYRSDKVWETLQNYDLQKELGRLSLYVRGFIKNEHAYEKIM